jgi:hypothetical protein
MDGRIMHRACAERARHDDVRHENCDRERPNHAPCRLYFAAAAPTGVTSAQPTFKICAKP